MQKGSRRRGIVASRSALSKALSDSGFRSQAQLAEAIAERELLDNPPKDSVSRAFQGKPVDLTTISRIAAVLEVAPHSLYATSATVDKETNLLQPQVTTHKSAPIASRWIVFAAMATLSLAGLTTWFLANPQTDSLQEIIVPSLGAYRTAIAHRSKFSSIETSTIVKLTQVLRSELDARIRVLDPRLTDYQSDSDQGLEDVFDFYVELVEIERQDQMAILEIYWRVDERSGLLARQAVYLPDIENGELTLLGSAAAETLNQELGFGLSPTPAPRLTVVQEFVNAMQFVLDPGRPKNLDAALSSMRSTVALDDSYARGHAGLCFALTSARWLGDEVEALKEAEQHCSKALQLDGRDEYVQAAMVNLLTFSGRLEAAIDMARNGLRAQSESVMLMNVLAQALFEQYRREPSDTLLAETISLAKRADDAQPQHWRRAWQLGGYYILTGQYELGATAFRRALALEENEYILANFGVANLCLGRIQEATSLFQRTKENFPETYIADEYLSLALLLNGQLEAAQKMREAAVAAMSADEADIHQVWGNLGDVRRLNGHIATAIEAYAKAVEIVAQDDLMGNANDSDRIAATYYQASIAQLTHDSTQESLSQEVIANHLQQLEGQVEKTSDPLTLFRIAQSYKLLGQSQAAQGAVHRAVESCRIYEFHPDVRDFFAVK